MVINMDLRIKKTKQAIKEAFIELMKTNDINKITVTDISKKAMINRKTFYLHYEVIEDLISEFLNDIADDYIREIDKLKEGRPHEDANRLFFEYFDRQEDYVQKILCYGPYKELCNVIFDKAYYHALSEDHPYRKYSQEKQNIILTFYRSTTLDIYRQWRKDQKKMSLDEIVELSNQLICYGVKDI